MVGPGASCSVSVGKQVFKFFFGHVVIDVECVNALGSYVVLVFENAQEQMLCADDGAFENLGLEVGDFQNFLGLLDKWNVA